MKAGTRGILMYGSAILTVGALALAHALPPKITRLSSNWGTAVPPVVVCSTAPDWAYPSTVTAAKFLRESGFKVGAVTRENCDEHCLQYDCEHGKVVVDVASQTTLSELEPGVLALCAYDKRVSTMEWAVIEVVSDSEQEGWNVDLMMAHELAHCALGYGHVQGSLPGISPPRGHLMNPSLPAGGWNIRGMKQD